MKCPKCQSELIPYKFKTKCMNKDYEFTGLKCKKCGYNTENNDVFKKDTK